MKRVAPDRAVLPLEAAQPTCRYWQECRGLTPHVRPEGGYRAGMRTITVGLVADPASPTQVARRLGDLDPPRDSDAWDVEMVSEPFTTGSEDAGTALDRLQEQADAHGWDVVVGLTELPL